MKQPRGFVYDNSKIFILNKSLYKLKQNTRQWYSHFDKYLLKNHFMISVMCTHLTGMRNSFSNIFIC